MGIKSFVNFGMFPKSNILLISLLILSCSNSKERPLRIAAASDLKFALDSIARIFSENEKTPFPDITYGSSGKLFEQIRNGAPFDLFFSADESLPEKLHIEKLTNGNPKLYGVGRLVIWSKKINPETEGIRSLMNPSLKKISMANPIHAPYGKKAKEFLINIEIWDSIQPKIVYGENISQAAQFLSTGAADAGIIAFSIAKSESMQKLQGNYFLIPDSLHSPLRQSFVALLSTEIHPKSVPFHNFVLSDTAQKILRFNGFSIP